MLRLRHWVLVHPSPLPNKGGNPLYRTGLNSSREIADSIISTRLLSSISFYFERSIQVLPIRVRIFTSSNQVRQSMTHFGIGTAPILLPHSTSPGNPRKQRNLCASFGNLDSLAISDPTNSRNAVSGKLRLANQMVRDRSFGRWSTISSSQGTSSG